MIFLLHFYDAYDVISKKNVFIEFHFIIFGKLAGLQRKIKRKYMQI